MADFRKGQLVAVRDADDCEWALRVYDHISPEGLHFCVGLERGTPPCWWNKICSAEVVWPDIFLARDRVTVELLQEMRLRLHQRCEEYEQDMVATSAQIRWLCKQLASKTQTILDCPPDVEPGDQCECGMTACAECWAQASLEATKEEVDGA